MGFLLFATASRPAMRTTQPPNQWVQLGFSLVVKWPECEADHLTPSSAEVNTSLWCGA